MELFKDGLEVSGEKTRYHWDFISNHKEGLTDPEFCVFRGVRVTCDWSWHGEQCLENAILGSCLLPSCM